MEVLVSFLEGAPDQPLVTGCLYHKEHVVPYDLPANKTRSLFKTLSSPGGGGYNELRIEDRQGQEQIYIHAQRDWDQNIEHDQKIRVGHQRHDSVEANSYSEFKAEEHRTTHGERRSEARASDHLTVGASQHVKISQGRFVEAGEEIHYYAGSKVVIDAGLEFTAQGGGSWLKLDPSGVSLSGATVKMNSGGAPGAGSGIQLLPATRPVPSDTDRAGSLTRGMAANGPLAGHSSMPETSGSSYDLHFQVCDQATGEPLRNFPYVIKTEAGKSLFGRTDDNGMTHAIASSSDELASIEVYDDLPPINPGWDT